MPRFPSVQSIPMTHDHGPAFGGTTGLYQTGDDASDVLFNYVNMDNEPVDLNVEVDGKVKFELKGIKPKDQGTFQICQRDIAGKHVKLVRYRPGLLRIPGNGGGDCKFQCPANSLVEINIVFQVS